MANCKLGLYFTGGWSGVGWWFGGWAGVVIIKLKANLSSIGTGLNWNWAWQKNMQVLYSESGSVLCNESRVKYKMIQSVLYES